MMKRWLRHNDQLENFSDKIFNYNLMLIVIVAFVCSTYVMLNIRIIDKFNDTYVSYNDLNGFYFHVKEMNDNFQVYLYQPSDANYKAFRDSYNASGKNIDKIMLSLKGNERKWRFELLQNMIDKYYIDAELVIASNLQQEEDFNQKYQKLIHEYELIAKTSGEYYDIVTEDMQLQKIAVNDNQRTLHLVSLFFILFVITWLAYFSITMIRSMTDPIEKIMNNMNRIKMGEYDLSKISNVNKEMNVLCLALEDLSRSIQKNIQYANDKSDLEKRVLEQQNENLKKDELLAQSELRVLQNQINPHFLFNTLNMIYKKAYSEGAYETSELMERTSRLLRYALDNTSRISSLKKELAAIENYNYIQAKRYGERIRFIVEAEEDLPDIRMPGMILQPLVENAVLHGLQDVTEDGEVMIEVTQQNDHVIISVSDNGVGMASDELEKLILNDYAKGSDDRVHLGLYNVTSRLKKFYGDEVSIIINSLENCGFEINIKIDLRRRS